MPVRVLNGEEVARCLPMPACIEAMDTVLRSLARGQALLPLRTVLRLPSDQGFFGVMPAATSTPDVFGVKVISVFPKNEGTRYDSHQGSVLLFEPEHGTLAAILDASAITAIRTAAVSAVATRALAQEDVGDLAILGTGVQARSHLDAMQCVRKLRRVRAWSRHESNRLAFAKWARHRDVEVETPVTIAETVKGADLICTTTSSHQPVLALDDVTPGAHINAVGSSIKTARELDSALVAHSRLYVDRRESAFAEAGDFLIPRAEGLVTDAHILAELGELLLNPALGRRSPQEITVFKSLGLAVEDLAAGSVALGHAEQTGTGLVLELGGIRQD
jgi:ornithine cyclodeaminase